MTYQLLWWWQVNLYRVPGGITQQNGWQSVVYIFTADATMIIGRPHKAPLVVAPVVPARTQPIGTHYARRAWQARRLRELWR